MVIKKIYNCGEEKANTKPNSHKEKINIPNYIKIKISSMVEKKYKRKQ